MYKIREAKPEDMKDVLILIRELARYEKLSDKVKFDDADFEKNIFEKEYAKVLVCEMDLKIIGYAVYYFTFSTFLGKGGLYLEDIYVQKQYRLHGIGKAFFRKLARICDEKDLKRLEWVCLNWNEPSIDFYENMGAVNMHEWRTYRLEGENLKRLIQE